MGEIKNGGMAGKRKVTLLFYGCSGPTTCFIGTVPAARNGLSRRQGLFLFFFHSTGDDWEGGPALVDSFGT
jgi:hypothetical protein